MALSPNCLGSGSFKPVQSMGLGQSVCISTRIIVSCSSDSVQSSGTLQNEDVQVEGQVRFGGHSSANGSEATSSQQNRSLQDQLRLLNLETLSKRVLGSTVVPKRLDDRKVEGPIRESSSSSRVKQRDGTGHALSNSGVVGEVLDMLKTATESQEVVSLPFKDWEGSLTAYDVVTILNSLSSWRVALSFFRWLQAEQSSSLNIFTYNVMLKVLRRGRQWKSAEGVAVDMIHAGILPDNITYSTLISCASRCHYQKEAMVWFDRMHEAGCVPDAVTYSSMIDVYGKTGMFDEAVALYKRLRKAGWKPDKVTYGTMVRLFGRAGYPKAAVSAFREMKASGIQPDSVVYNILISVLGRMGRMSHALKIFEEMEREGVKPSAITLSTVIETYNRAGNIEEGLRVFHRLKSSVNCDVIVYNTVLKMCGDSGLVMEADQYFEEMLKAGCQPDDWTYRNMIRVYAKQGMALEAQRMFSSLIAAGYEADVMAYTCLLQAYGNAKDYQKVKVTLNNMALANCSPDDRLSCVVLNLLSTCDTVKDYELVRSCLQICNERLVNIVEQIFSGKLILKKLRSDFQSLLRDISEDSHKPICNSLLHLCWRRGNRNQAFQLLPLLSLLGVYRGLQSKSSRMWCLHLRSLSTGAAHCALLSWLSSLKYAVREGQELPGRIIIETGVGRQTNADEVRLIIVISSILKDMSSPFEESVDRKDWLEATGADVTAWLETKTLDLSTVDS